MFGGNGKHTSRNVARMLQSENGFLRRQLEQTKRRAREAGERERTERNRREAAEGLQAKAERLVARQAKALQDKNDRIAELERLLRVTCEDTVETPSPTAADLAAA